MSAAGSTEWFVFWVVAAARFFLPLSIPRYPLPGILASLVLDAVDQTIFQGFPGLNLEGYQGYDKALDIYYLTIAYIATLRNWVNPIAFKVSRALFYWRLAGVVLFEVTHLRWLLLIFPNAFEYFFIFYEAYRARWDPAKMSKRLAIVAAAAIWIVIKLPQEYWIHIGQIDTTDWIKTDLFGASLTTGWSEIISARLLACWGTLVGLVLILVAAGWLIRRRLRPADYAPALSADAYRRAFTTEQVRNAEASEARYVVDAALVEKMVLVSLVSLCFAQVLPAVRASDLQLLTGIALLVLLNTVLSCWLVRRGFGVTFTIREFLMLGVVNLAAILEYSILRSRFGEPVDIANAHFFVLLLTLLVTLFDRYRQVYVMRWGSGGRSRWV
jgi:hypothetical protein